MRIGVANGRSFSGSSSKRQRIDKNDGKWTHGVKIEPKEAIDACTLPIIRINVHAQEMEDDETLHSMHAIPVSIVTCPSLERCSVWVNDTNDVLHRSLNGLSC